MSSNTANKRVRVTLVYRDKRTFDLEVPFDTIAEAEAVIYKGTTFRYEQPNPRKIDLANPRFVEFNAVFIG